MSQPFRSLIVCTTPRSGSGLLCEALWNTGIAGRPDEYFGPKTQAGYCKTWGLTTDHDYFEKFYDYSIDGKGVFSAKIHWPHMAEVRRFGRRFRPEAGSDTRRLFDALFPDARYVWLRRRDKVRQAVSLWRADLSGVFSEFGKGEGKPAPAFRCLSIFARVAQLETHDANWERLFRHCRIDPLVLYYEDDLAGGCEGAARRVLDYAGIATPESLRIFATRVKQADDQSEMLVSRYRAVSAKPWWRAASALASHLPVW